MTSAVDRPCPHCGRYHVGVCLRVRLIEYHENGTIKRVEYHPPIEQPQPPFRSDE